MTTIAGRVPEIRSCGGVYEEYSIVNASDDWYQLTTHARWLHQAGDTGSLRNDEYWWYGTREAARQFIEQHADQPASASMVHEHRQLFVAAPEEVTRCALFAADVFSDEVDMLSEVDKVDLVNKILQRWVDNTPAYPPMPVRE